jgi:HAD superfamily phosphatase (TIGR01668 family)
VLLIKRIIFSLSLIRNCKNPKLRINSFVDIDFQDLKNNGIRYIISDIDQTITSQSENNICNEVIEKFDKIKEIFSEKNICFLTNEYSEERSREIYSQINIHTIRHKGRLKPYSDGYIAAIEYFKNNKIKMNEICFIGDRILTDVVGANNLGIFTIQVNPFNVKSDRMITKLIRFLEKLI